MLDKIANLLHSQEHLTFQLSNMGSNVYKLILTFQPTAIPKVAVPNGEKELVDGLIQSAELIRAELAKPKVFIGTTDNICDQLDKLLEITQSTAYQSGWQALNSMTSNIDKVIADAKKKAEEASAKKASKPAKAPAVASTCTSGQCDPDEQPDLFGGNE
jgi:hypothetical protein